MAPTRCRGVSALQTAGPQRASHGFRDEAAGLTCTLFLACIGLANSVGSQYPLGQLGYVALRGGGPVSYERGTPETCVPDLVANEATGLSLRDALLQTTAGTGQPAGPGAAGTLPGEARVEVRGRHCVGEIDPVYVSRSRNITLVSPATLVLSIAFQP